MNQTFTTPKGTVLPILDMRGKPYLVVAQRIVWFREECPKHTIETEFVSATDSSALCRAVVRDESGRILATSHKFEDKQGFPDFREKSETGAIGRALALIGYGTQFCADEFDEGERLADAPVQPRKPATQATPPKKVTEPQLKRLYAIQSKSDWKMEHVKAFILDRFNLQSSKDLSMGQYDQLVSAIESGSPPEPGAEG